MACYILNEIFKNFINKVKNETRNAEQIGSLIFPRTYIHNSHRTALETMNKCIKTIQLSVKEGVKFRRKAKPRWKSKLGDLWKPQRKAERTIVEAKSGGHCQGEIPELINRFDGGSSLQ